MNELGQWLRETREGMGLSLAEVEAKIRVRQRFIAALEAEEWNVLPGDVTARGFLRKYAAFLGLDTDEVMAVYSQSDKAPAIIEEPEEVLYDREVDYRPIEMNLTSDALSRLSWRPLVAIAAVFLLIAAAWWVFTYRPAWIDSVARLRQSVPEPADLLALETTPEPTPTRIVIRVTATPTDMPLTPPDNDSNAEAGGAAVASDAELTNNGLDSPPPGPVETLTGLQLNLLVNQRSWVRVVVDGEVRLETVLEPGQENSWQAQESIIFRTGNAAGAVIRVNGEEHAPLGGPGEVIELSWQLQEGKVIEITPTPTPGSLSTTEPQVAQDTGSSISPTVTVTATTTPTLMVQARLPETHSVPEEASPGVSIAEVEPTSEPTATPNPTATPRPTATPVPTATPTAVAVAQADGKLFVELEVTEEAWIRVTVDGENRLERILEPGTQQDWQGDRSIQMRIGNAGGVKLKVNGQPRNGLGQTGEVVDLVWSVADNGRVVEATPTPTPRPPTSANQSTASNFQG